jgi:hypothetical protein
MVFGARPHQGANLGHARLHRASQLPEQWTVCPHCYRRTEVLYFLRQQFGCRRCCHLGYRSQRNRPSSIYGMLDQIFARNDYHRWHGSDSVLVGLVDELRDHLKGEIDQMMRRVTIIDGGGADGEGQ